MRGREPAAACVEPQRGRPGQDPDSVPGPDRVPVLDALGVVPHPIAVDQAAAGLFGDTQHPAVDVLGHPAAPLTCRSNGATTAGPVPHVTWKRGTELPCPSAR